MDDLDIWSSPDPSHEPSTTPAAQTKGASGSTAKKGLFDDDFNAPWGRDDDEEGEATVSAVPSEAPRPDGKHQDLLVDNEKDQAEMSPPTKAASPAAHASGSEDGEDAFHEAGEEAGSDGAEDDGFGEFDDDGANAATANAAGGDDDFGDFGDFPADGEAGDDNGFGDDDGFGDDAFGEEEPATQLSVPIPSAVTTRDDDWSSLSLQDTSYQSLSDQIQSILALPTTSAGPSNPFGSGWSDHLGQDQIRHVEGPAQVLIGESSRQAYSTLSSAPALRPTDWLRSRTRRDLYISLGVPINLDELVDTSSSSSSTRLPPLNIKLEDDDRRISRPASAAATTASASSTAMDSSSSSNATYINGSDREKDKKRERERAMDKRREDLGLGRPPDVDFKRMEEVCSLSEDQLTLLTLPSLQSLKRELETFTTQTSTLLTHHLTLRESLQSDSETYNGLIADLVAGAASRIGGGNGKNVKRSSSVRISSSGKRSTFGGASSSASTTGRFGTPPPPNSASTANSTPRSGSPAPGSAGWRR